MLISANLSLHKLLSQHTDWHLYHSDNMFAEPFSFIGLLPPSLDLCKSGYLYVCEPDHPVLKQSVTKKSSFAILVVAPDDSFSAFKKYPSLITTDDFFSVFNELTQTYIELRDWEKNLDLEIIHKSDPQVLIDLSETVIGYPIILFNRVLKLLAYTQNLHPTSKKDWVFQSATQKGYLMRNHISLFMENNIFERIESVGTLIEADPFQKNSQSIYKAILVDQQILGYFSIICVKESDVFYIKQLFEILSAKFQLWFKNNQAALQNQHQHFDYLFTELIESPSITEEDVTERLAVLGFQDNTPYLLLQIPIRGLKKLPALHLKSEFSMAVFSVPTTIYDSSIYMLINKGEYLDEEYPENMLKKIYPSLTPLLTYYKTYCIVSQPFDQMFLLRTAWKQCQFTELYYSKSSCSPSSQQYLYYEHIKMEHLLYLYLKQMPANVLLHPGLKMLLKQNDSKSEEHIQILKTYLNKNCNLTDTSRALNRHRNSLLYHIQQIEENYHICFEDPAERSLLFLNFRLLEIADMLLL